MTEEELAANLQSSIFVQLWLPSSVHPVRPKHMRNVNVFKSDGQPSDLTLTSNAMKSARQSFIPPTA